MNDRAENIRRIKDQALDPKQKKKTFLRRRSAKRESEEKIYFEKRDAYLSRHKFCECGCGRKATDVHHKKGKIGRLLNDVKYFMAVARICHRRITDDPAWAIKMGYSILRNKK